MKHEDIKVLVSEEQIKARVEELGKELEKEYEGKPLTIVCILKGCIPFTADLIRNISIPFTIDVIHASSYLGTMSTGAVKILSEAKLDLKDRHVVLIDDILDTGRTLKVISDKMREVYKPASVKRCVLLDKPSRRSEDVNAEYVDFTIPNEFVVGYGLDYDEYYRNLPFIGVLENVGE